VGRWGRNHGQNGGLIKQRTKMGISCRLYPILMWNSLPEPLGFRWEGCEIPWAPHHLSKPL
jgi:hypothetical protein